MRHRMTLVTPPTAPARGWPASDLAAPVELRGSDEEVVAPRLLPRLDRGTAAEPAVESPYRSVLGLAILAGAVGFGSVAAALLVGLAAAVGWAARAMTG